MQACVYFDLYQTNREADVWSYFEKAQFVLLYMPVFYYTKSI